ncbi:hypothetical protein ACHWQZ_G008331 [Mnemiopsis leidyi]
MSVLFLLCISLFGGISGQCLSEEGEPRTWFLMLKMPNRYSYLYADDINPDLKKGTKLLTEGDNPVGRILDPIYSGRAGVNYILYNDQVPDGPTTNTRGHTKGAVIWRDDSTIQWLIHSVPNFPPQPEKDYSYPETAKTYGQSFLCVNMEEEDLAEISQHLYYTWPLIYNSSVSEKYTDNVPYLDLVLRAKHIKHDPSWVSIQTFETAGEEGFKFTAFAKTGEFGADLYKEVIGPYFNSDLYAETWQRGQCVPSNCTGHTSVYNVREMELLDQHYREPQDHSKWAVTADGHVCVGGINRMTSQYSRGGGSLCFQAGRLWKQIWKGIQSYEKCEEKV